tara:strand:+ start:152 stop:523 length:372 start_codon:yes stop_codon:yes gene_type:complete
MSSHSKIVYPTSGGFMKTKSITARCTNTKEVILTEPLSDEEIIELIALAHALDVKVTISKSAKMLVFKCDSLDEALEILQEFGLIEYIGSLKEIIDWKIIKCTTSNPSGNQSNIIKFKPEKGK